MIQRKGGREEERDRKNGERTDEDGQEERRKGRKGLTGREEECVN